MKRIWSGMSPYLSYFKRKKKSLEQEEEERREDNNTETDDIRRDIIAAACLSDSCKETHREFMRVRVFSKDLKERERVEEEFLNCLNDYANKHLIWGSALTSKSKLYYFNRKTREAQFERPQELDEEIKAGKDLELNKKDYQEAPWKTCEFLHIQALQCEKNNQNNGAGCALELKKFVNCMKGKYNEKK